MVRPHISRLAASAAADAVLRLLDGGYLRIYSGEQPADPDVEIGNDHVLLAELRFGSPAYAPAIDGFATSARVTGAGKANGVAAWGRTFMSDGTTPVWDGSVGISDTNITLSTTSIMEQAVITLTGLSYTQARKG